MFDRHPRCQRLVGADPSQAAIRAARWAVDEVAGTDIPLRLLYVTKAQPERQPGRSKGGAGGGRGGCTRRVQCC